MNGSKQNGKRVGGPVVSVMSNKCEVRRASGADGGAEMPVNVQKRQADRLGVLKTIFEDASGIEGEAVRLAPTVQERLGLDDQELQAACAYLAGEGLIEPVATVDQAPVYISAALTHRGAVEMEQALKSPNKPTKHLPSVNSAVIIINSSLHNSPIQSGSPDGHQTS